MPAVHPVAPALDGSTVPPHYVHKRDVAEVLLTGWEQPCEDSFVVSARWPTRHRFYDSTGELYDPLFFAESVRQCFPLLSHAGYGIPFGHHLIWHYLNYEVAPAAMGRAHDPAEVDLYIACTANRRRPTAPPTSLTMDVTAFRDGARLGTASTQFSCHAPAVYRRLRGAHSDPEAVVAAAPAPPAPVPAALVGRDRDMDVVLARTEHHDHWLLRNDTSHPVLFDHPMDHSPGMLLLEGARQAARASHPGEPFYPVAFDAVFLQFAELDAPCRITAEPLSDSQGGHRTRVVAAQGGEEVLTATVTATVAPRPRIPAPRGGDAAVRVG
ncbi:ScbA/BarX family gamma-butyrolactone biosynthesis protein [Streptomyces sp. NPDC002851]